MLYTRACERVFKLEKYDAEVAPFLEDVLGLPRGGASSAPRTLVASPARAAAAAARSAAASNVNVDPGGSAGGVIGGGSRGDRHGGGSGGGGDSLGVLGGSVGGASCSWSEMSAETMARIKATYGADFKQLGYDAASPPAGALDLGGDMSSQGASRLTTPAALGDEQEEGAPTGDESEDVDAEEEAPAVTENSGVLSGAGGAWRAQHPEMAAKLEEEQAAAVATDGDEDTSEEVVGQEAPEVEEAREDEAPAEVEAAPVAEEEGAAGGDTDGPLDDIDDVSQPETFAETGVEEQGSAPPPASSSNDDEEAVTETGVEEQGDAPPPAPSSNDDEEAVAETGVEEQGSAPSPAPSSNDDEEAVAETGVEEQGGAPLPALSFNDDETPAPVEDSVHPKP